MNAGMTSNIDADEGIECCVNADEDANTDTNAVRMFSIHMQTYK